MSSMNIGFDLDKIFINHPPFVPSFVISKLYGEKANGHLAYRIPGKFEQYIRKMSHASFLRPSIKENIAVLKKYPKKNQHLFLISSRYGFLEKETKNVIKRNHLDDFFPVMSFNYRNEQPHIFKDKELIRHHIDVYVDDDLPLLKFLGPRHPDIQFFWLNNKSDGRISSNIQAISKLSSLFQTL